MEPKLSILDYQFDQSRFWSKVQKTSSCWLWKGGYSINGYGQFSLNSRTVFRAHRVAYELLKGKIPRKLQLDHFVCQNRGCVNPEHLEPVTAKENIDRSERASKQYCIRGHPLFGDNIYLQPNQKGSILRVCKSCEKIRQSQRRRRILG